MKAWDLFDMVHYDYVHDFDLYIYVESLTDKFNEDKLNLLCRDFDFYLFMKKEEFLSSISEEEIEKKITETQKAGKKLPMMADKVYEPTFISDSFISSKNKKLLKSDSFSNEQLKKIDQFFGSMKENRKKTIDIMKLFDPNRSHFYSLYRLRSLLVDLKRKHTNSIYRFDDKEPQVNKIQPIHWLKGEDSLRQFLDTIKNAGLIEIRETDEIIQEHFRQTDKSPQPIQWSKTNRLLIYLFSKLTKAGLVDTMDRQFKLITEHFLDKKGQPFKRDSLKQDFQNMKYSSDPRGAKTIDKIIQELTL